MFSKPADHTVNLLTAARAEIPCEADSKVVKGFKNAVGWDEASDEARFHQRKALTTRLKALGLAPAERAAAKRALLACLPVPEAVIIAQRQARALHKSGLGIAKMREELEALRLSVASEVGNQRAALASDLAAFRAEVEKTRQEDTAYTQRVAEKLSRSASGDTVRVEVSGEEIVMPLSQIAKHRGLLRAVFCDGFATPDLDERGVYHLGFPYVTRDDFRRVAQFYNGELPPQFSPEDSAHLCAVAGHLELDAMVEEIKKRTTDVPGALMQRFEAMEARFASMLDKTASALRPESWEVTQTGPYSASPPAGAGWEPFFYIDRYNRFCWRRPRRGPENA